MRLERLHLRNFRCFENLSIEFDKKLTVIVAENGAGKTAILDAIAIGFGRYLSKLPNIKGRATQETDIRISQKERPEAFTMLAWEAISRSESKIVWSGGRKRSAAVSAQMIKKSLSESDYQLLKSGLKEIDAYTQSIVANDLENEPYFLPVIAYYGTNRAIRDEVKRRRGFSKSFSRFEALRNALEPDSRFRSAFEWFSTLEDVERRTKDARRDLDFRLPELELARQAILRTLPVGFANPRTEIRPLRFVIDRALPNGATQTLRINQLSDGFRVIIGLVMDLALRMALANGRLADQGHPIMNPLDLPAIVLIDEVDLHLHPSWQQHVLNDLCKAFRGTQFIVTTHSPQVLTCVDHHCIRVLKQRINASGELDTTVDLVDQQTKGVASSDLLAEIMGVDPIPDLPEARNLARYHALIQQNLHSSEEGLKLRTSLEQHFGARHPVILECERMIRLQAFKQKLPLPQSGLSDKG